MTDSEDAATTDTASVEYPMPLKKCSVCQRQVPLNEWDHTVCDRCRSLAGYGLGQGPFVAGESNA